MIGEEIGAWLRVRLAIDSLEQAAEERCDAGLCDPQCLYS